jgi:enamine deaminase RidA (YjgF/YER057c/UK114 family)
MEHVVRTRMYITDLEHADAVGRAHHERLGGVRPCATMVAVKALFADAWVEIEADAVIG